MIDYKPETYFNGKLYKHISNNLIQNDFIEFKLVFNEYSCDQNGEVDKGLIMAIIDQFSAMMICTFDPNTNSPYSINISFSSYKEVFPNIEYTFVSKVLYQMGKTLITENIIYDNERQICKYCLHTQRKNKIKPKF